MTVTREQYLQALNLPKAATGTAQQDCEKLILARAYEQRSFEIELYWKRATFFWGFQAVIFAAFSFVWKEAGGPPQSGPLALSLSSLGILTAIANHLSARGSKFWQENWEKHIDMLEDAIEGRLYKTVWLPDGAREYSVSGVNLTLSRFFIFFWIIVAGYSASRFLDWHLSAIIACLPLVHALSAQCTYVIVFSLLTLCGAIALYAQTTKLVGSVGTETGGGHERALKGIFSCWRKKVGQGPLLWRRPAPSELSPPANAQRSNELPT